MIGDLSSTEQVAGHVIHSVSKSYYSEGGDIAQNLT